MPSIDITPEQAERLEAVKAELAADVVGKYGHVRTRDAIEYLLDEHETERTADEGSIGTVDADAVGAAVGDADGSDAASSGGSTADAPADEGTATTTAEADDGDANDDAMLNAMMNLLDTHDDKWGESGGDERYEVTLPDGDVEHVRTKDDVRALLFKHYR
jgi:hypothetical protein